MTMQKMPNPKAPFTVVHSENQNQTLETKRAALEEELQRLDQESQRQREASVSEKRQLRKQLLADAEAHERKANVYKQKKDIDEALEKAIYFRELAAEIVLPEDSDVMPKSEPTRAVPTRGVFWTTLKIAGLVSLCLWSVMYSGDWILGKYPQAAIYNEVSFQKIVFGFAVYIGAFVAAIVAFAVFFPGFGRYFNPFNQSSLDFYDDFEKLDTWKRNLVGFGLWAVLFLGFIMVATGKLD